MDKNQSVQANGINCLAPKVPPTVGIDYVLCAIKDSMLVIKDHKADLYLWKWHVFCPYRQTEINSEGTCGHSFHLANMPEVTLHILIGSHLESKYWLDTEDKEA